MILPNELMDNIEKKYISVCRIITTLWYKTQDGYSAFIQCMLYGLYCIMKYKVFNLKISN